MPEIRIQTDHDSLNVLENAIQDYNFNTLFALFRQLSSPSRCFLGSTL